MESNTHPEQTAPATDPIPTAGTQNTSPFQDMEPISADDFSGVPTEPDDLTKALQDVAFFRDLATRNAAELDNFRKRMAREKQDALKFANQGLLETLLPVIDNFEFGLMAAKAENEGSSIYMGMSMVHKQLQDFLREQGVEEIPTVGLPFDPAVHDAVSQQPTADVAEGQVLQQVRRGFRLKDRLLRPASVVVAAAPTA